MATYVMSDIHGQPEAFDNMLEKIEFKKDDILYLLGDYVDWGPGNMAVIKRIIHLQQSHNIICLIGNHDKLFLEVIASVENIDDKEKMMEEAKLSRRYNLFMRNGGENTLREYMDLEPRERDVIRSWLENLDYYIDDLEVEGRKYYLCHSVPLVGDVDLEDMLWDRVINKYSLTIFQKKYPDTTLISGHTIVNYFDSFNEDKTELRIYKFEEIPCINIDCGGKVFGKTVEEGYGYGVLACIRLEDMKEFYVTPGPSDIRVV